MKNCLKEFEKADVDGSGTLTMDEMHKFLESSFNNAVVIPRLRPDSRRQPGMEVKRQVLFPS